jgi:hypothetical protein
VARVEKAVIEIKENGKEFAEDFNVYKLESWMGFLSPFESDLIIPVLALGNSWSRIFNGSKSAGSPRNSAAPVLGRHSGRRRGGCGRR